MGRDEDPDIQGRIEDKWDERGDSPPKIIVPARYSDEKSENIRESWWRTICIVMKVTNVMVKNTRITAPTCQEIAGISLPGCLVPVQAPAVAVGMVAADNSVVK